MDLTQLPICSSFLPLPERDAFEAVGLRGYYWETGSKLQIYFLNGELTVRSQIAEIATEWTTHANLEFVFHLDHQAQPVEPDILIQFWPNGGGQSHIGINSRKVSRSGKPSMFLPYSAHRGVVLHEFGHALGLMHEHLNPVAGIKWDKDAVHKYYWEVHKWTEADVDNNVLRDLSKDETNYTTFDRQSIMIYEIPSVLTLDGFSVDANSELSAVDIEFIGKRYPY